MESITFEVEHRSKIGKNQVKTLKEGDIPAVIYGSNITSLPISVNLNNLLKLYNRQDKAKNTILNLKVTGEKDANYNAIAYQIDYHPVKRKIIHIDFLIVDDKTPVKVQVPCRLVGTAKGQKMAGILIHNLKLLKLTCLPSEIPASFNVDITDVGIGESIRVSHLKSEGSIKLLNDPYDVILQIDAPRVDKASQGALDEASESQEPTEGAEESVEPSE